jgi:hypothetical protein
MTERQKRAYCHGYLDALYDFAWWKDGVLYVGSGVYTYKQKKGEFKQKHGIKEKSAKSS